MTIEELEKARIAKGYKLGWIVKQILVRKDLTLLDYAAFREFKHPEKWVDQMHEVYQIPVPQDPNYSPKPTPLAR
jgi:hypothetical protein